ncbi:DUF257 family protein [Thermococcus stetteri]|uniref:DUF257 family protein n=1 Tax=Thermococcus stetteri TaxID=49900 RepID=UPI001FD829F5|nr:DUF257 family protein [Thermococcus stetteri]
MGVSNERIPTDFLTAVMPGDIVLIKYTSTEPVERVAWGEVIPSLHDHGIVSIDFWGIGEILVRKFAKTSGIEYTKILDVMREIKVIKVGPGAISYGEVLEDIVPTYEPQNFLRNYYSILSRVSRLPKKPRYVVMFGLSHYIYFNPEKALKSILTAVSTIPIEDIAIINFVNTSILKEEHIGILEELSTKIAEISGGRLVIGGGKT